MPMKEFPIIHSSTFKLAIIELESQRFDQVQGGAGGCAEAGHIAGIGGNLRFDENDVHNDESVEMGLERWESEDWDLSLVLG